MIKTGAMALAIAVVLTGCHTAPKSIYQWGGYQPQVYQHFKGESPDQQIAVLEKDLQTINANGNVPPPGYHAHLGLLYSIAGKPDQVIAQFQEEKKLFPESAVYMDFLLEKMKKGEK
ncbi:MAG: DUF4810 domain-containing protein [Pseudomonadota bacterium]